MGYGEDSKGGGEGMGGDQSSGTRGKAVEKMQKKEEEEWEVTSLAIWVREDENNAE